MSDALLAIENLEVRYGAARAVNGVSLDVRRGSITAIVGPNGAGKSTLLKAICGLVPSASGSIRYEGAPIQSLTSRDIAMRGIAHVPEGRRLFAKMSVDENLQLGGYLRESREAVAAAREEVFTAFPRLRERATQRAGSMSGGEQQMLAIGRALMAAPKLILADEVSQGLAPVIVQEVYRQLAAVAKRGVTVLLVEQNARLAFKLAEFVYVLEQGRIAASGTPDVLAASDHVRNAYLGVT